MRRFLCVVSLLLVTAVVSSCQPAPKEGSAADGAHRVSWLNGKVAAPPAGVAAADVGVGNGSELGCHPSLLGVWCDLWLSQTDTLIAISAAIALAGVAEYVSSAAGFGNSVVLGLARIARAAFATIAAWMAAWLSKGYCTVVSTDWGWGWWAIILRPYQPCVT